jgi:hypothetical protein
MIKEAINRILELAPIEIFEFGGEQYTSKPITPVRPHRGHLQCSFEVSTLSGITDWLMSDDGSKAREDGCIVHVIDECNVSVVSYPDDYYREDRHGFIKAKSHPNIFGFGHFHTIEEFIINASSKFEMTENLEKLLLIVSSIKTGDVTTVEDSGIAQSVTVANSTDFNRVGHLEISPFQQLKPFRTFSEIEQPESRFLLRVKAEKDRLPTVALFEADNSKWKLDAMKSIAEFLGQKLDGQKNINIIR